jgi:hypothetical protein
MGEAIAVARLEAALTEQARLAEEHDRATGTASELAAFARLQAANLRVAMCRRALQLATARRAKPVA